VDHCCIRHWHSQCGIRSSNEECTSPAFAHSEYLSKDLRWELEHQLFVHSTGYVPLSLAFDHQGNLWTGYTTKLFKLVPRAKPESGEQYNIVELSGSPAKCTVRLNRPTTVSSPVAILFSNKGNMLAVANDQLHLIDQNGFKDQAVFDLLRPSDHEYYRLSQSPGRKSLVVVIDGHVTAESSYTWLDLDTLNIIHRCTYPPALITTTLHISDHSRATEDLPSSITTIHIPTHSELLIG